MEKEQKDFYLVIYKVYFNDGKTQYLQPDKYKLFFNYKDANDFVTRYNKLMKPQNREILHADIIVPNVFVGGDNIKQYREDMDGKEANEDLKKDDELTKVYELLKNKINIEIRQSYFDDNASLLADKGYSKAEKVENVNSMRLGFLEHDIFNFINGLKTTIGDKSEEYSKEEIASNYELLKKDLSEELKTGNSKIDLNSCLELVDNIYDLGKRAYEECINL